MTDSRDPQIHPQETQTISRSSTMTAAWAVPSLDEEYLDGYLESVQEMLRDGAAPSLIADLLDALRKRVRQLKSPGSSLSEGLKTLIAKWREEAADYRTSTDAQDLTEGDDGFWAGCEQCAAEVEALLADAERG